MRPITLVILKDCLGYFSKSFRLGLNILTVKAPYAVRQAVLGRIQNFRKSGKHGESTKKILCQIQAPYFIEALGDQVKRLHIKKHTLRMCNAFVLPIIKLFKLFRTTQLIHSKNRSSFRNTPPKTN